MLKAVFITCCYCKANLQSYAAYCVIWLLWSRLCFVSWMFVVHYAVIYWTRCTALCGVQNAMFEFHTFIVATAFHFNEVYLSALIYCNCQYLSIFVRSDVFLAMTVFCWCMMSSSFEPPFWKDLTPLSSQFCLDYGLYYMALCSLVEKYKHFRGTCCLHQQSRIRWRLP